MRPLELTMEAFGPYLERQSIDFRPLNGLFLICGETGSGKTMLLDAICFALYGKSSGGGRDHLEQLRCQRAQDDRNTCVRLLFSHKDREYLFTRELSVRRKRSGAVEMRVTHNALRREADGNFLPLLANPTESRVNETARQLLGLDAEQFCRVALLPQGKFERFLVAGSSEKEAILQTLFDVSSYSALTERLAQMAKERGDGVQALEQEEAACLARHDAADLSALLALREANAQAQAQKSEQMHKLKSEEETARNALARARELAVVFADRDAVLESLRALGEKKEDIELKRTQLRQALAARNAKPALDRAQELRMRKISREKELKSVLEQKKASEQAFARVRQLLDAHTQTEAQQSRIDALARLNALRPDYEAIRDARNRLASAKREKLRRDSEADEAKTSADRAGEALLKAQSKAQALQETYLAPFHALQRRKEQSESYTSALKTCRAAAKAEQEARSALDAAKEARRRAAETLRICREEQQTQLNLYLSNAAGALAGTLETGRPCPVCGSREHPHPHATGGGSNQAALRAARQALKQAEAEDARLQQALENAQEAYAKARSALDSAENALDALPAFTDGEKQDAFDAFEAAVRAKNEYEALSGGTIPELEDTLNAARSALAEKEDSAQKAQHNLSLAREALQLLEKRLDPSIRDPEQLEKTSRELKMQIDGYAEEDSRLRSMAAEADKAIHTAEAQAELNAAELEKARDELCAAEETLLCALRQSGFQAQETLLAAILPQETIENMQSEIGKFEYDLSYADETLDTLNKALFEKQRPDLALLETKTQEAELHLEQARTDLARQSASLEQLDGDVGQAKRLHETLEKELAAFRKLDRFARVLKGERGVGLTRFVLNVMLGSVCGRANELLSTVHSGRYAILPTLEGDSRSKRGLKLAVLDSFSGKTRDVESLSGGEKFLVSLALSIGLKTVVQGLSGCAAMEAMFIDEGFGSLDASSVQEALQLLVLSGAQTQCIGIISHVQILRETLSSLIEVVSEGGLSRVSVRA